MLYLRAHLAADRVRCMQTLPVVVALSFLTLLPMVSIASEQSDRGKYLAEQVAQCQNCHTPRGADGELDRAKWMKGAELNVQPIQPIKDWHKMSPDLTPGSRLWQRWGEKGITEFLKTGKGPSGHAADPPMPTYNLKAEDAEAIVVYLKELK